MGGAEVPQAAVQALDIALSHAMRMKPDCWSIAKALFLDTGIKRPLSSGAEVGLIFLTYLEAAADPYLRLMKQDSGCHLFQEAHRSDSICCVPACQKVSLSAAGGMFWTCIVFMRKAQPMLCIAM